MGIIGIPGNFGLWVNKEGRFGVMDVTHGEIWHPLDDEENSVRVQRLGLDSKARPIFSISFIGTKEVEDGRPAKEDSLSVA